MLPSKYFNRNEFACKCGCGFNTVDAELLDILTGIRKAFCNPVIITSGCRCVEYNKRVNGKAHSQHLLGRAADIIVKDVSIDDVWNYLNKWYPDEFGFGKYDAFIHIDTRSGICARW